MPLGSTGGHEHQGTARDVIQHDGSSSLLRFRNQDTPLQGAPVLLVPSLINRWYVLDLYPGGSVAAALVEAGLDTFCLDWGIAKDEDRYLSWDEVIERLARAMRTVRRQTGSQQVVLIGYCMGATLAAIQAAREPHRCAALVNLAGPIDFGHAGLLGHLVDPRWFDAEAISAAGNVHPNQMQSGFTALRPTQQLSKMVRWLDKLGDPAALERAAALDRWASDNIPFPAAAYERYIGALYQANELFRGVHHVAGQRVDLATIDCPILTVVAERDTICPPPAAEALAALSSSKDCELLSLAGGHVGAVVGSRAAKQLYPRLCKWIVDKACT